MPVPIIQREFAATKKPPVVVHTLLSEDVARARATKAVDVALQKIGYPLNGNTKASLIEAIVKMCAIPAPKKEDPGKPSSEPPKMVFSIFPANKLDANKFIAAFSNYIKINKKDPSGPTYLPISLIELAPNDAKKVPQELILHSALSYAPGLSFIPRRTS